MAGLQIITIDKRASRATANAGFPPALYLPRRHAALSPYRTLGAVATPTRLGFETVRSALSMRRPCGAGAAVRARWPSIAPLGFDERFKRMWDYYLASCEGGFRAGTINVGFFKLSG